MANGDMRWAAYKRYFTPEEFECRCGCGLNNMQAGFMDRLYAARDMAEVPFVITSGSRCPEHNRDVSGAESSDHLTGHGADIACRHSRERYLILAALIRAGFTRIGISQTFIHAGDDPDNPLRVVWLY